MVIIALQCIRKEINQHNKKQCRSFPLFLTHICLLLLNVTKPPLCPVHPIAATVQEAQFDETFPPTWVQEGDILTLRCTFTAPLPPPQQEISWFLDGGCDWGRVSGKTDGFTWGLCLCPPGVQLLPSPTVDLKTCGGQSSITVKVAHKENEGVYTVRLRTGDHVQEHSAYVYVKGERKVGAQRFCDVTEGSCLRTSLWFGDLCLRTSALVLSSPSKHAEDAADVSVVAGSCKQRVKSKRCPLQTAEASGFQQLMKYAPTQYVVFPPPVFSEDIHHAAQPSVSLGLQAQTMKNTNLARKRKRKKRTNLKRVVKKDHRMWHFVST